MTFSYFMCCTGRWAARSNFKETMVSDLSSPLFPQRKGVHPVFSCPSFQLPQRGRQITACRDWRSKNETDASSLGEVCFFLKATFVQRMRPRRILLILIILQIDSLRSPFGLPLAVFLRCASILSRKNRDWPPIITTSHPKEPISEKSYAVPLRSLTNTN